MAGKLPAYRYRVCVVRVIDGDTLECDVDLGFYTSIRTKLRLFGVNCPETNTPEGIAAREFVRRLFDETNPSAPDRVTADTLKADKYGNRWDAIIYLPDGTRLNDLLVSTGHAKSVL